MSIMDLPAAVEERMAARIAHAVEDRWFCATGSLSAIPASGLLLARQTHAPNLRVYIQGSERHNPFRDSTNLGMFELARRGKMDLFFLGGAQIDGQANINLTVIGDHDDPELRLAGSRGSAQLYYTANRVIIFRLEHTKRIMVPKVDFITSPGVSDERTVRHGGPMLMITNLCVMRFLKDERMFELESIHPGYTVQDVIDNTGFEFRIPDSVSETPLPSEEELQVLRTYVKDEIEPTYPQHIRRLYGAAV